MGLETRHQTSRDQAGEDLVERLEDDQVVLEVPGQVEHAWFDTERGEPEGEDVDFVFALGPFKFKLASTSWKLDCTIIF